MRALRPGKQPDRPPAAGPWQGTASAGPPSWTTCCRGPARPALPGRASARSPPGCRVLAALVGCRAPAAQLIAAGPRSPRGF